MGTPRMPCSHTHLHCPAVSCAQPRLLVCWVCFPTLGVGNVAASLACRQHSNVEEVQMIWLSLEAQSHL